jgi:hypothetical protein
MSPRREKTGTTMISEYARDGFSLSNAIADSDYHSVPKLLRRAADHLDERGDVAVRDLWLEWSEYKDPETYERYEKLWPMITINWPDRRETPPPKPAGSFSTNFTGEAGCGSVPKLLRRVADHLDELGDDAVVSDMITHTEPDGEGCAPWANTYYSREEGWVQNHNVPARDLLLELEKYYADSENPDPDEE